MTVHLAEGILPTPSSMRHGANDQPVILYVELHLFREVTLP